MIIFVHAGIVSICFTQIFRVVFSVAGLPAAEILTPQLLFHQVGQFSVNMYSKIHWYIFSSFHKSAQVEVIFSSILLLNITLSSQKSFMMLSEFFISIPVKNSSAVCDELMKDNIFAVPLTKGVRLAVCSMPLPKVKGLAAIIKAAIDKVDNN